MSFFERMMKMNQSNTHPHQDILRYSVDQEESTVINQEYQSEFNDHNKKVRASSMKSSVSMKIEDLEDEN